MPSEHGWLEHIPDAGKRHPVKKDGHSFRYTGLHTALAEFAATPSRPDQAIA